MDSITGMQNGSNLKKLNVIFSNNRKKKQDKPHDLSVGAQKLCDRIQLPLMISKSKISQETSNRRKIPQSDNGIFKQPKTSNHN